MEMTEIKAACAGFRGVTMDYPFGPQPACMRVGRRIFAQLYPEGIPGALRILLADEGIPRERVVPMVTLSCDAVYGDFFRRQYPGAVLRPYHAPPAQWPYAVTVLLDGAVPDEALMDMVRHAYKLVFGKLAKKDQRQILEAHSGCGAAPG